MGERLVFHSVGVLHYFFLSFFPIVVIGTQREGKLGQSDRTTWREKIVAAEEKQKLEKRLFFISADSFAHFCFKQCTNKFSKDFSVKLPKPKSFFLN